MFQTLSMEVRPFPTVNAPPPAPAPTASSVAPSVPEQPPPPPTNTTTAASAGPASPHDASQGEDATNGHSSSRRPGNLWTAEDREDMFNRRENGEGWETICAVSVESFFFRYFGRSPGCFFLFLEATSITIGGWRERN
jgi:hypothetical protein